MSQHDLHQIIRQQQKQLAVIIQALLATIGEEEGEMAEVSRSLTGLNFYFHFLFYFYFSFLFFFYFQNNLGQRLSVMLSHQSQLDGVVTGLITGYKRKKQKVLEQSDVIQHGQHMLASCYTHGHLGQDAQQLAQTMGTSI